MDEGDEIYDDDFEHVDDGVGKLKKLIENINWEMEATRRKFLRKLDPLITETWILGLPNLMDLFQPKQIQCLLWDSISLYEENEYYAVAIFICFVSRSGYRDEPEVDENGKPLLRRTTPLHRMARSTANIRYNAIVFIFDIYSRYDVNYIDEFGLTHFHVACRYGHHRAVEKFLELGQDPNCLWLETGDSPLHLAVEHRHWRVGELLLRAGANPKLINKDGLTPLHLICKRDVDIMGVRERRELSEIFLMIIDDKYQMVQVDNLGKTPLHYALYYGHKNDMELLLRRGADPNAADVEGSTPLHIICHRKYYEESARFFFNMTKEVNQLVQVDARDRNGRTPLQLAVANLHPKAVDLLLENGADLSEFVFPTASEFGEQLESYKLHKSSGKIPVYGLKFETISNIFRLIWQLEHRGYELTHSDALKIMAFSTKYELSKIPSDLDDSSLSDQRFVRNAKNLKIKLNRTMYDLTVYDFIQLRPDEATKLKFTIIDFLYICQLLKYFGYNDRELIDTMIGPILFRQFFWDWALDSFMELIHYRLPILCCEMILGPLVNEDLYNICLAAYADQSHEDSKKNSTKG